MIVVLAEKPSVARELAQVLGANTRHDGYLEGNGYRVTWAVGHLVALAEPDEIQPEWKSWARESLPMLPERFPLRVLDATKAQFRVVERLFSASNTERVIVATDAGREGELIFRYVYEKAECQKPFQRLWLSSLTAAAIREAFARLEPGTKFDGLAAAARARSQADWLVGMNLSRAYTLTSGTLFSVGRVQTPTLAMVVARDATIAAFVPVPYLELEATFEGAKGSYKGLYYEPGPEGLRDAAGKLRPFEAAGSRLPADGAKATLIADHCRGMPARVAAIEPTTKRIAPPQLYDLTELQRDANRRYGLSAQETLEAAQTLYERQALSYPRTDSRHLSTAIAETLPAIVRALAGRYAAQIAPGSGTRPLGKRFVDDAKVGDHHALIPTDHPPAQLLEGSAEALVYDLVCRRLLMAWHDERVEVVTRVLTEVTTRAAATHLFATQATAISALGWSALEPKHDEPGSGAELRFPVDLAQGDQQRVLEATLRRKQTTPPKPHTEATLLSAMEGAGKQIQDEALREAMRDAGLGTPATRAATIETLLKRGYLERRGKTILSTELGRALIRAVHPVVASPEMTGRWEQRLKRMERSEEDLAHFMRDIAAFVREAVRIESTKPAAPRAPRQAGRSRRASHNRRKGRSKQKETHPQ